MIYVLVFACSSSQILVPTVPYRTVPPLVDKGSFILKQTFRVMKSYVMKWEGVKCHRDLCWTLWNKLRHTLMLGFVFLLAPEPNIQRSQIKHWHSLANLRLLGRIWGNIKHSLICSWKCGTRLWKLFPGSRNTGRGEWRWDQIKQKTRNQKKQRSGTTFQGALLPLVLHR